MFNLFLKILKLFIQPKRSLVSKCVDSWRQTELVCLPPWSTADSCYREQHCSTYNAVIGNTALLGKLTTTINLLSILVYWYFCKTVSDMKIYNELELVASFKIQTKTFLSQVIIGIRNLKVGACPHSCTFPYCSTLLTQVLVYSLYHKTFTYYNVCDNGK